MVFLQRINLPSGDLKEFPFNIPSFKGLESLDLSKPITVFVGENGSGKSTLLKALALKLNLPAIGSTDLEQDDTLAGFRAFSEGIVTQWNRTRTYRGFFFRAEDYFGFVKRLR